MSSVMSPPRPRARRRVDVLASVVIAAAIAASAALLVPASKTVSVVPVVTITNSSRWHAEVDVSGREQDGRLRLGTTDRETSRTYEEVLDQGDVWVFRFGYGGVDAATFDISRDDLARQGWTVQVPEDFASRLTAAGMGDAD